MAARDARGEKCLAIVLMRGRGRVTYRDKGELIRAKQKYVTRQVRIVARGRLTREVLRAYNPAGSQN
jgi:hypothetical protein